MNGTAPSFPIFALGDPSLDPETTWGGSVTVRLDESWIVGEASLWANVIEDYIYFAPVIRNDGTPAEDVLLSGAFPRFTTTQLDAKFWGGEGSVALRPFSVPLEFEVSAGIVRAEDSDGGFLVFVPPDRGSATVRYTLPDGCGTENGEISVSVTRVARQDRFDLTADFAPPPGGYTLLGARVGTEIPLGNTSVFASVEATNLTNTAYRDYTSLVRYFADEIGRSVIFRVREEF